jgi:hypothetical protein
MRTSRPRDKVRLTAVTVAADDATIASAELEVEPIDDDAVLEKTDGASVGTAAVPESGDARGPRSSDRRR